MNPAVAEVRSAVDAWCDARGIPAGATLVVAVSGGADSMALAIAAQFVASKRELRLVAAVIDHGLQPDAVVRRVSVGTVGGPEAAAREVRYAELVAVATERAAVAVLTGHTRNDQAESVLLGLTRGSGPGSVRGMPAFDGVVGRPLLAVTRDTTVAACAAEGITPWEDPHNHDPAFTRVRIRNSVMPILEKDLGPGIVDSLARTACFDYQDRCGYTGL